MLKRLSVPLMAFAFMLSCSATLINAQEETQSKPAVKDAKKCDCKDGECEGKCQTECAEGTKAIATTKSKDDDAFTSTHKQTAIFVPQIDGEDAKLNTFRIREDGMIVVCVAPRDVIADDAETRGFIQVYSDEFELTEEFPLPFNPYSLDLDASGNMFVAGDGQIARVSREGEIEKTVQSPTLVGLDMDELKKQIKEEMMEQQKEVAKSFQDQIDTFQKKIDEIEEVDEEERSKKQKRQLKNLKNQVKDLQTYMDDFEADVDDEMIEWQLQSKSAITAVAVTQGDVFVSTAAKKGFGYEVYRMNRDLEEAEVVLEGLRGCCGQMDIYARGEQLYVAENTKFAVGVYDREGKEVSSFGERLADGNQGFGSCCNPMNVVCCPNGDILTAESSIGKIKRFDSEGNLIGYIGRARIGGGCKHVAFGHNEKTDCYYVQYEDKNQICVLAPASSVSVASDPRVEELSIKLTGTWERQGDEAKEEADSDDENEEEQFSLDYLTDMKSLTFGEDGSFSCKMATEDEFNMVGGKMKWLATKADGDKLFLDIEQADDMITYRVVVDFADAADTKISITYDGIGEEGEFQSFKQKAAAEETTTSETSTKSKK